MAENTLILKIDKESAFPLLEGLRGPKGEKGEDGQRGERGERGEQGPRGYKGEAGSAEKSAQFLKEHNIWLEDTSVDTVLMKIIELSGCHNNFTPKSLDFIQPKEGAAYIDFTGEPHYKLAINNGEKREFQSDNMRVAIDESMKGNVRVDYYDLMDRLVTTRIIELVKPVQGPDFGAFVKDVQLTTYTGGATLSGVGKVYANGAKIIPTAFTANANFSLSSFTNDVIRGVVGGKVVDIVELDLTKVSNSDSNKGQITSDIQDMYEYTSFAKTTVIKVNKNQVVTLGGGPFSPDAVGQSDKITFKGAGNNKIQFNGSELVAMEQGARYEYVFSTDTINKLG